MKKTIQTKRSQASASGFRALYAKTGGKQRKMKAATATMDSHADLEADIPNVGMGRALLVILVLHVVAIGAFLIHTTYFERQSESNSAETSKSKASPKRVVENVAVANVVAISPEVVASPVSEPVVTPAPRQVDRLSQRYIVVTGDSYSRIAQVRNVDEIALRALNGDRPIRAGVVLDLPAELSSRPVAVANIDEVVNEPVAVMVKPLRNYTRAIVVEEEEVIQTSAKDSGQRYTVVSGDTLWRISKRYGVSREQLLILNGIKDANKLSIGDTLRIPNQ